MTEHDLLAQAFESQRKRLRGVAYRMLGSASEADDAVQESWLRLSRSAPESVENLNAWLTTVVARVCLDMLRTRKSRREEEFDQPAVDAATAHAEQPDVEHQMQLADSVGIALLIVLETLTPSERVAFVLHDMFDLPFDEIAPIVGRTPTATRQLASRARRRVQGAQPLPDERRERDRRVVDAFLAASRNGDFTALLALLDPEVVSRADAAAVASGAAAELRGPRAVAEQFSGRARAAQPALIDGNPGLVWAQGGEPRVVFAFSIADGKVVGIELLADPDRLRQMEISLLG